MLFYRFRDHIFPTLGMASCLYLIYYLPPTSWLCFAAWLNFGFVIYAGYGILHSRLGGMAEQHSAERLACSARIGVWLNLIGTAMLFIMHGLDVLLTVGKSLNGWAKWQTGFSRLLHADAWLQVSWFLIVPLAVNAAVLCPIIMYRRVKANRLSTTAERSAWPIWFATVYMVAAMVYLTAVFR